MLNLSSVPHLRNCKHYFNHCNMFFEKLSIKIEFFFSNVVTIDDESNVTNVRVSADTHLTFDNFGKQVARRVKRYKTIA